MDVTLLLIPSLEWCVAAAFVLHLLLIYVATLFALDDGEDEADGSDRKNTPEEVDDEALFFMAGSSNNSFFRKRQEKMVIMMDRMEMVSMAGCEGGVQSYKSHLQ